MNPSNPVGRPSVVTDEALSKMEEAFSNDATDEQASFLANISLAALYRYQEDHPEFRERKKALKGMMAYQAKMNVKKALNKQDLEASMWILPRKEKVEYSERKMLGIDGGDDNKPVPILNLNGDVSINNSHKESVKVDETNQSDPGRNLGEQNGIGTSVLDSLGSNG